MSDAPPRTPRQPKLRSSCDGCGAAKLKCDRGRPQCGRCLPLGLVCVYGVSRKMGKPPRGRIRVPEVPSVSRTPGEHAGSINRDRPDDNSYSSGTGGSVGDGIFLSSGPFPSVNNVPSAWGAVDGYLESLMTSLDAPDALRSDLYAPSLPDFTSLEFGDDLLSTLGSPELEGYSTPAAQTKASQTQVDENIYFDSALMPTAGSKGHDCSREAYDILGSLSFLKLNKAHSIPQSALGSASTTASTAHRVPFDHILSLNRESSERLGRLLTCSCASCPHLALLYASIISLVLTWYQQAASCTQKVSWSPAAVAADTAFRHVSPSGSTSGSQSPWSSTTVSTVNTGGASTPTVTGASVLAVAPTQMAVGSFNIDDQQVQTALAIQLLLSEIRRTGCLIDLFTSRSSSGADEFTFNSVDNLYKSLSSWLRREHSRIADIMKSRLNEVST